MGRWFGYRPGYVDLTRIFVTDDLKDAFFSLATVEQEIRGEIEVIAANNERPVDVGARIRTNPGMTVTAANKMRTARSCFLTYSGSKIQARHINPLNETQLKNNLRVVANLIQQCEASTSPIASQFKELSQAYLYRKIDPELILQFLDSFDFSPGNIKFTPELLSEYIDECNQNDELTDWSIALVSGGDGPTHEIIPGRKVSLLERTVLREAHPQESKESVQLRSLSPPRDELIDLYECFDKPGSNVRDLLKQLGVSEPLVRKTIRPKERGLLLLYPLNPHTNDKEPNEFAHSLTRPLKAKEVVFGVTFVFPESGSSASKNVYVMNKTVQGRVAPTPSQFSPPAESPAKTKKSETFVRRLSKSQYCKGKNCQKAVWLYNFKKEVEEKPSELQQQLFDQGTEVGKLAQEYFPGGELIHEDYRDPEGAVEHTKKAMAGDWKALYEAAFLWEDILIRCDVITRNGDG